MVAFEINPTPCKALDNPVRQSARRRGSHHLKSVEGEVQRNHHHTVAYVVFEQLRLIFPENLCKALDR